jgi:hypothetical protein
MNIYVRNVAVALSVLTFCFLLTSNSAFALTVSFQLGSGWEASIDEQSLDNSMTQIIANYSQTAGYAVVNWYGSSTTHTATYAAAMGGGSNQSIAFYIGHGSVDSIWHGIFLDTQYSILDDYGNQVYDDAIFPFSNCSNDQLVFLISCYQGDEIGGVHWPSGHQYGMPYAWLHDNSISNDGYDNASNGRQVFLGFSGPAPMFTDSVMGDHMFTFVQSFYFALLCLGNGMTVKDALDYASQKTYSVNRFDQTELYTGYSTDEGTGYMKVYGNGNIKVSNAKPRCGLKTELQGAFYVPLDAQLLKVEGLFDNGTFTNNLIGDQTGTSSPYGSFVNISYPDGYVNEKDYYFVSLHFGKSEGDPGWDYMADVNGDGTVNLKDIYAVALNIGASGTCVNTPVLLSNTRIVFSTGLIAGLDRNGCVPIPWNATSFNVTLYGNPEGAMVIFW